jgi:hypothetical protein
MSQVERKRRTADKAHAGHIRQRLNLLQ